MVVFFKPTIFQSKNWLNMEFMARLKFTTVLCRKVYNECGKKLIKSKNPAYLGSPALSMITPIFQKCQHFRKISKIIKLTSLRSDSRLSKMDKNLNFGSHTLIMVETQVLRTIQEI